MGEKDTERTTIFHIDGHPINGIPDFECDSGEVAVEYFRENKIVKIDEGSWTCTVSCKFDRYLFWKIAGLWNWAFKYCPNRRVAHLMKHGKTERVRRKNFNRAVYIMCSL